MRRPRKIIANRHRSILTNKNSTGIDYFLFDLSRSVAALNFQMFSGKLVSKIYRFLQILCKYYRAAFQKTASRFISARKLFQLRI